MTGFFTAKSRNRNTVFSHLATQAPVKFKAEKIVFNEAEAKFFSRVLRDSISHFRSVHRSVGRSVCHKVVFKAFYHFFDGSEWQKRNLEV